MKLILFTVSIIVLGCSARPSPSVQDELQSLRQKTDKMQMEINELKSANTLPKSG